MDRSELWTVQTPQVFEAGLIRAAVEKAAVDGESLTDECGAVERLGMKGLLKILQIFLAKSVSAWKRQQEKMRLVLFAGLPGRKLAAIHWKSK